MNFRVTSAIRFAKWLLALPMLYALSGCTSVGTSATNTIELSHTVVGGRFEYVVKGEDTLSSIEARFAEPAADIAQNNGLDANATLTPGQRLVIEDLHVVPDMLHEGILVNLPQRLLYFFRDGSLRSAFPVALGKPTWPTPVGAFNVIERTQDPEWVVPDSIQKEMREHGETVITSIPPGPDNPLGKYRMRLSLEGYAIHSTNAPHSIYHFRSHGCIRLHPDDAEYLFSQVDLQDAGKNIYAPTLLAALDDGSIYLEVNPDIYSLGKDALQVVLTLAAENQLLRRMDWVKVTRIVAQREGIARQVSLEPEPDAVATGAVPLGAPPAIPDRQEVKLEGSPYGMAK